MTTIERLQSELNHGGPTWLQISRGDAERLLALEESCETLARVDHGCRTGCLCLTCDMRRCLEALMEGNG